ncbi:MAG: hypothetical protein NC254_07735 [bacterium]|nr:hypothetical protein [bacterium]
MKKKNNAEQKENHTGKRAAALLRGILEFVIPAGMTVGSVLLYGLETAEQIRTCVLAGLLLLLVQFAKTRSRIAKDYLYDNDEHPNRFTLVFLIAFGLACLFPLFTQMGWPYLSVAVALTLFSNAMIGMVSFTALLTVSCMLAGASAHIFVMYLICGLCAVVLFSVLDESFRVEIPIILSCMVYVTSMCANTIITQNRNLSFEMFVVPIIGLFLNVVLMLMLLWYINTRVVRRESNRYVEINDPEYDLMVRIKAQGMTYYYHAIHTAYLCNKIASRTGMDTDVVRAAAFYHEAGVLKGENTKENLMAVVRGEYHFPPEVCEVLSEYKKGGRLKQKETAVLFMSAMVVDTLMGLFAEDKNAKIDYKELIEGMFHKQTVKGRFSQCSITIGEMTMMKKILMEENLYYDFLR